MSVTSPCIKLCVLDAHGFCQGCKRTKEEIAAWLTLTDKEKQLILDQLQLRKILV